MEEPIEIIRRIETNTALLQERIGNVKRLLEEPMAVAKQPTKTLNFDDDVLKVLRNMEVTQEGDTFVGRIREQLERNLYVRTNKALETLGGKWNRKAGGHIFPNDPREGLGDIVDTGQAVVVKDGFFPTPRVLVEKMLTLAPLNHPPGAVLEPSAGDGAIVTVLLEQMPHPTNRIDICEFDENRRKLLRDKFPSTRIVGEDFLLFHSDTAYNRIYMNPPFENGQDILHVRHAYDLLGAGGELVAIMSEGCWFRPYKSDVSFRIWLDAVNAHVEKIEDGHFSVKTRMVHIRKANKPKHNQNQMSFF